MSQRDTVRGAIRRALHAGEGDAARSAAVAERLGKRPRGIVPKRGDLPPEERVALFRTMAERADASVEPIGRLDDVPEAVSRYLRDRNLPASLRMGDDPRLATLDWTGSPVEVAHGASDGNDTAALSHATTGIAEIGAVVLTSGQDNPTTLNFLPDAHVVVIDAKDIVGDYESAWDRVRAATGDRSMPRTVNIIVGPSRSGDIQQTILLGAHGPRNVHILIVGEADGG